MRTGPAAAGLGPTAKKTEAPPSEATFHQHATAAEASGFLDQAAEHFGGAPTPKSEAKPHVQWSRPATLSEMSLEQWGPVRTEVTSSA